MSDSETCQEDGREGQVAEVLSSTHAAQSWQAGIDQVRLALEDAAKHPFMRPPLDALTSAITGLPDLTRDYEFPYLEQERVSLVCELRPLLKLPIQTQFGQVTDAADLELGPLLSQVHGRVDKSLSMHLGNLVRVRNALAHLEPVSAADVEVLQAGMRRRQGG